MAHPSAWAMEELDQLPTLGMVSSDTAEARAWTAAAGGHPAAARNMLLDAAREAADRGRLAAQARLLHQAARLGAAELVAEDLHRLAERCEGLLIPAFARHAAATATGDLDGLVAAADEFEGLGTGRCAAGALRGCAHAGGGDDRLGRAADPSRRGGGGARRGGTSSKEIAARLFVSVRTVDNHLQRVYAKLGVTGRNELAQALAGSDAVQGSVGG